MALQPTLAGRAIRKVDKTEATTPVLGEQNLLKKKCGHSTHQSWAIEPGLP
jgi:hypothetical protein